MKIYITGATGFLGLSFIDHYKSQNTLYLHVRGNDVKKELQEFLPDLIIHCAGEIYNPALMFDSNINLTHEILHWLTTNPSTRMIYIGSSSEYGKVDHATSETDRINPVDIYQATKGAASLLCQGYSRSHGLQIAVARIYSGYGYHERPHRLFPKLYDAFYLTGHVTLRDGVHDFIYIDDFLTGIDCLLANPWPLGEIVNFGSGIQSTNLQVLQAWQQVTGLPGNVTYQPGFSKAFESNIWCCNPEYARIKYGFSTKFTLEQGIEDFIRKKQNGGIRH